MCLPKFRCNRQTIDKVTKSARLFIFCDEAKDERLKGGRLTGNEYFNAAISDNFCIGGEKGHRVGEKCDRTEGDPSNTEVEKGVCTLLQTEAMMDVDIRFNYPL